MKVVKYICTNKNEYFRYFVDGDYDMNSLYEELQSSDYIGVVEWIHNAKYTWNDLLAGDWFCKKMNSIKINPQVVERIEIEEPYIRDGLIISMISRFIANLDYNCEKRKQQKFIRWFNKTQFPHYEINAFNSDNLALGLYSIIGSACYPVIWMGKIENKALNFGILKD